MNKIIVVYGSLIEGLGNHHRISQYGKNAYEKLGEDVIKDNFTLVSLGGFPGLIPNTKMDIGVKVEVYSVNKEVYRSVEILEGFYGQDSPSNFYNKYKVQTKFGEGEVYVLDDSYLKNHEVVESGDWKEYLNEHKRF